MHHSIVCKECQAKLKLKEGKTVFRGSCPRCNGPIVWSAPEDGQSTVKAGTAVESETVATSKSSASGKSSPSEAAASSEKEFLRQVLLFRLLGRRNTIGSVDLNSTSRQ